MDDDDDEQTIRANENGVLTVGRWEETGQSELFKFQVVSLDNGVVIVALISTSSDNGGGTGSGPTSSGRYVSVGGGNTGGGSGNTGGDGGNNGGGNTGGGGGNNGGGDGNTGGGGSGGTGDGTLRVLSNSIGETEKFQIVQNSDGSWALKSTANGNYIAVVEITNVKNGGGDGGNGMGTTNGKIVSANQPTISAISRFSIVNVEAGGSGGQTEVASIDRGNGGGGGDGGTVDSFFSVGNGQNRMILLFFKFLLK